MYHHEEMRHAEKLVHHLQCQGLSEGLCNQNMTIFTISSKLLVRLLPHLVCTKLGLMVHYHKPECPVGKWDYCVQGQGHSEG